MIQQGIDDSGNLIRRFHETVTRPDPEQMRDSTSVKLSLIEVVPQIQPLELVHVLLQDRLL